MTRLHWPLRISLVFINVIHLVIRCILSLVYYKKPPSIPPVTDPLLMLSATTLASKIRQGEITSYQVVEAYVKRIKEVNPYLNAVVDNRFEAALTEAKECDEQLKAGKRDVGKLETEKPLYGVPITVKECCAVKGLSYTAGVLARKGIKATVDGAAVRLLRNAGAIPLCATNVPEMCCNIESTNRLYGRTNNPYDGRYTSGGSSGGESALLGAGASLIGIGSDLGGSLRIPALFSGIFGHKLTSGIIPSEGHYPYSDDENFLNILTLGSMSRYAEDLDLSIKVLTKCDRNLRLDVPVDVKRLRIYYRQNLDKGLGMLSPIPEMQRCVMDVANHFAQRGIRVEKLPMEWPSMLVEITLATLLNVKKVPPLLLDRSDPELRKNPVKELGKALIGQSDHMLSTIIFDIALRSRVTFTKSEISYYTQYRKDIRKKLQDLLGEDGVFICPTFRVPAFFPRLALFEIPSNVYCAIINSFGFPATHVPIGLNRDGLPIGVQVIAAPYQDRLCLAVAKELEKTFGGWKPPTTTLTDEDFTMQKLNWPLRILLVVANAINLVMRFIMSLIYHKKPPSLPPVTDPLLRLSATTLAKKIREGEITSHQVVKTYVKRIKEVNPYINAVVEDRFATALMEAKACDEQLRTGKLDIGILEKEMPLYGVPITVKQAFAVKDLSYEVGVLARKGMKATVDGAAVRLFRNAGAIPLCITNTPEMCGGLDSTNRLQGRTYNPYDGRYTSGGSSGGEGALLGAGASVLGFGSDVGGSIRIPALFNGIFGHKPTTGIVPCEGHLPYSEDEGFLKILSCGPMSRYADDLSVSTKIMTAQCGRDLRLDVPVDVNLLRIYYRQSLDKGFGIPSPVPEMQRCVTDVANHFVQRGIRTEKLPMEWPTMLLEIMLASIINVEKMPQLLIDTNNPEDLLGEDGVFICPTFRVPAIFPNLVVLEIASSVQCGIMNVFGFPATHVPIRLNREGLPIGVQVVAAPYQDRLCLAVAKELEKAFGGWKSPATSAGD